MSTREVVSLALAALALVILFANPFARDPVPGVTYQQDGFAFDGSGAASDRRVLADAIGRSRPEAQRLIGLVDGMVLIQFVSPANGALGTTSTAPKASGRYIVQLDLATAYRAGGQAGIDRLILHELGHVVDFAIVPPAMRRDLFAQLASGYGCSRQGLNECAEPEEQFAETFAKWATGNVGVNVYMGYATPLPRTSLDEWARPLTQLRA